MRHLFPILLLVSLAHSASARQVSVVASVNDNTVGTQETLMYSIEIQGAPARSIRTPVAPEAVHLELVQNIPSTQSSVSIVNGVMEQSYTYRWAYRPTGEGSARIGAASVVVGNETFRTDPITVTVVPQSQRPNRPSNQGSRRLDPFAPLFRSPQDPVAPEPVPVPGEGDLFIRATPSAQSVVRNQQVTIQYELFFRDGIQLRQSRLTDSWDAEGFWREELNVETRPIPQIVVQNGVRYNKIVLKRAAVFPTRTGVLSVDSLRIESEAVLPSRSSDPFQQLFSLQNRFRPVELASPSVTIESKPFPDGAPDSFSGAVGNYTMDVTVDRTDVEVGSSIQVIVRIRGSGNLATLSAPEFQPPAAFELYEPQVSTSLNRAGARLSGVKTFTFVLVPRSNGTFELPRIEFSHYDPSAGIYKTDRSNPVTVIATGTATTPATVVATTNGLPVDDVAPRFEDAGTWVSIHRRPLYRQAWPYLVLLAPLIVLGVAYVYERHQRRLAADIGYARSRRAHPLAKKHLNRAKELMNDRQTSAFFGEVERAVLGFVGNRLNISEKGLTRPQLNAALSRAGVDEAFRGRLTALLQTCDRGRFAPTSVEPQDLEHAYEEASDLIVLCDSILD